MRNNRYLPATLLALGLGITTPAMTLAQGPAIPVNITAQPLDQAVTQLAEQTGLNIGGDTSLLEGRTASPLSGDYTPDQALQNLLQGTGVTYERTGENAVMLKPLAQDDSEVSALPTVQIFAATDANPTDTVNYNRADIEASQPQDMKDLFKEESSVSVGGPIAMNQKVYVRGVEETAMAVTVDGARQNNKVFHHNATNLIDPALLKAVRASASVAPADDGPGAIGGSLAYETIDVNDVLAPDRTIGGFLDGRYATNGDQLTTSGSLYGRAGDVELLGYLKHMDGDDYEDGNGDTVDHTSPALISGLAKIAYENDVLGRLELSHEVVNDDTDRPYRANFADLTAGRPVPESRVYDLTRTNTVFNYSRDRGEGLWNPEVTLGTNETDLETREHPLAAPDTTLVYNGITESDSATVQNLFHTPFATVTAGVDYYDDTATFRFEGDPDLEENAENVGTFIQVRQPVGDWLKLSYGARYDRQEFTGTDGSDHDDSGVSANLSGEVFLNEYVSINAGYSDAWGGVALAENFILNGAWVYDDVESVESKNYTAGLRVEAAGFFGEANVYQTEIENGRTPSWGDGPDLSADFDIEGYDLAAGYLHERGELSVKYSDIESEKDGEVATSYDGNYFTVPLGKIITVNGALAFPSVSVDLGMNAEFALENDAVEESGAKQDSYQVVGLYADYRPIEPLVLRLSVDNLTDEAYTDRASYGHEFPTVETLLEPGRSFALSARYTF
ncbi:TonB-dependent receptor [Marinobacter sp. OP 3.4]|uniref:TonB-dependent receptor n=1 Tax=Marinobacter sp. OP 3.4 TaxID=3076501 RepID=UPI002E1CC017